MDNFCRNFAKPLKLLKIFATLYLLIVSLDAAYSLEKSPMSMDSFSKYKNINSNFLSRITSEEFDTTAAYCASLFQKYDLISRLVYNSDQMCHRHLQDNNSYKEKLEYLYNKARRKSTPEESSMDNTSSSKRLFKRASGEEDDIFSWNELFVTSSPSTTQEYKRDVSNTGVRSSRRRDNKRKNSGSNCSVLEGTSLDKIFKLPKNCKQNSITNSKYSVLVYHKGGKHLQIKSDKTVGFTRKKNKFCEYTFWLLNLFLKFRIAYTQNLL